jgi:hypothetical protein
LASKKPKNDKEEPIESLEENVNDSNSGEFDLEEELEKLFKEELDNMSIMGEESGEISPVDREDKFITPDLIELPPKWFYEKVRDANLPKGVGLTDKMKDVLDKFYFEGATKGDLVAKYKIPKSSISTAIKRLEMLWDMYNAGTLELQQPSGGEEGQPSGGSDKPPKEFSSKAFASYTFKSTTFKEIDRTIAEFLRPQVERSTQFQDVMARIGMLTTYSLMQMGLVDRSKFVKLAEIVTEDPENLYRYVAAQLDALINVVDIDNLKKFSAELLRLREENRRLKLLIDDLQQELERYRDWLYEAGIIISKMFDRLNRYEQFEILKWILAYEKIKRGEVVATVQDENGSRGEEA